MERERYSRQTFLGEDSLQIFQRARVAVVGLGGGGSHVAQQLAHIGFRHYSLYDFDKVEPPNLNRTVGATVEDAEKGTLKIEVAERNIRSLQPQAIVNRYPKQWQDDVDSLQQCHLVFGCLDGFSGRQQLEEFCRRYLIAYIDIGMDVNKSCDGGYLMGGQVIASLPNGPCMRCMQFITDKRLEFEAERYGAAGPHPQVVWPNGVLASSAVGLAVNLLTGWSAALPRYLQYDGNLCTMRALQLWSPHVPCPHYGPTEIGDPVYRAI